MHVESDQPQLEQHLHAIASVLTDNGGFVADDFTVRQRGGEFSCAIAEQPGVPDRVLVSYPPDLTVPLWQVEWSADPDVMVPVEGLESLTAPQRALLDEWLPLVNDTAKLRHIRAAVPKFAVTSWPLRHHLADAGYTMMRTAPAEHDPKETLSAWHSKGGGRGAMAPDTAATDGPRWRLIPLKHLVNHDPSGATQTGVPGQISVVTSTSSDSVETFENYGDLDAMTLAMSFGFASLNAPLVHSVPLSVESPGFGRVQVRWRPPRYADSDKPAVAAVVPHLRPTDDGFELHHLTIRPDNRPAVARLLGMAAQSRSGMTAEAATRAAEDLLDAVCEQNLRFYRRLDELVAEQLGSAVAPRDSFAPGDSFAPAAPEAADGSPPPVLAMLAQVSLRQQQALQEFWS